METVEMDGLGVRWGRSSHDAKILHLAPMGFWFVTDRVLALVRAVVVGHVPVDHHIVIPRNGLSVFIDIGDMSDQELKEMAEAIVQTIITRELRLRRKVSNH